MAYIDFKRYTWLIELLNNFDGVTFEDIDDAWQDAEDLNPEGKPLPLKTFYNHIRAIKSIFDIDVDYSRKDKKYRVRTQNAASSGHMQKSLMSMLSLSATMDKYKGLSGRILYEEEPHVFCCFFSSWPVCALLHRTGGGTARRFTRPWRRFLF